MLKVFTTVDILKKKDIFGKSDVFFLKKALLQIFAVSLKIFFACHFHTSPVNSLCYIYRNAMLSSDDIFIASQYLFDMYRCFIVLQ